MISKKLITLTLALFPLLLASPIDFTSTSSPTVQTTHSPILGNAVNVTLDNGSGGPVLLTNVSSPPIAAVIAADSSIPVHVVGHLDELDLEGTTDVKTLDELGWTFPPPYNKLPFGLPPNVPLPT